MIRVALHTMIVDDIVESSDKYREQYGEKAVCLYQIGDFFEMNAYYDDGKLRGVDIHTVCNILNIQVTRKNKSIVENSRGNPMMAGFPLAALPKYSTMLVSQGWTVIVVRQVTPPPNVRREVTEILSPSTVANPVNIDSNYLVCVVFDPFTSSNTTVMSVGMAGIDVSTGHSFVHETYSTVSDPHYSYDEVYRVLDSYTPCEVVVITTKQCRNLPTVQREIVNCTRCHAHTTIHTRDAGHEMKPHFQNEVFVRAFKKTQAAHLGLEQYILASAALTAAIQFAYEHNETITQNLQAPSNIQQSKYLTLQYNSAVQLQVVGAGNMNGDAGEKPLMNILNRCSTAFGRRMFKERLLSPLRDLDLINARYDAVDTMICNNAHIEVAQLLCQVGDVERMARRVRMQTFPPLEWSTLYNSLYCIQKVVTSLKRETDVKMVQTVLDSFTKTINIEEASKYLIGDIRGSVFLEGYNDEIDRYAKTLSYRSDSLKALEKAMCSFEPCTLDFNDRDGYFLNMTKKRWESVQSKTKSIAGYLTHEFVAKPISSTSSALKVTHKSMEDASTEIYGLQGILQRIVTEAYIEFLREFDAACGDLLIRLAHVVGDIDIAATCARNAKEYNYVRPEIAASSSSTSTHSYVVAKDMRHPIIEHIHTDVEYVPNDVQIGGTCTGMLLYGLNSSGKSSYMKSIGLNVIMAQSGMFVAASHMTLAPYHSLFTRIQNNDNVYKRMSSFTVEMTELRNIFQRCDSYSLVLGDELCSGTESISATSIVAAGTHSLITQNVGFVFATHLHELVELPIIRDKYTSGRLQIKHIHVESSSSGGFIYNRKLRDGSGSSIYGLEVCAALGMPTDFIEMAHSIRKHIDKGLGMGVGVGVGVGVNQSTSLNVLSNTNTSRYNSRVYISSCEVCKERKAVDVHHIKYRCNDGDNKLNNLVPLCKQCHDDEHNGVLCIKRYVMTSSGRELDYSWTAADKSKGESEGQCTDKSTDKSTDDAYTYTDTDVDKLKPFLRYGVQGWQIKRTAKSSWKPIGKESVIVYINKKLGNMSSMYDINALTSRLLVV